jgi:hypothetical protein
VSNFKTHRFLFYICLNLSFYYVHTYIKFTENDGSHTPSEERNSTVVTLQDAQSRPSTAEKSAADDIDLTDDTSINETNKTNEDEMKQTEQNGGKELTLQSLSNSDNKGDNEINADLPKDSDSVEMVTFKNGEIVSVDNEEGNLHRILA